MGFSVSMPWPASRVLVAWMLAALSSASADVARAQAPATTPAPATQPAPAAQPGTPPSAAPGAPAAPAATQQPARGETPAVIIERGTIDTLLGKPVRSADDGDMGRIVDVIVDRAGTMRAVIIDFGGFLGVGNRKIAVDWRVLHFPQKGGMDRIIAELSRDQLRVAPVYKAGEPIVVVGRADGAPVPSAPAAAPTAPSPAPTAPQTAAPPAERPPPSAPSPDAPPPNAPPTDKGAPVSKP